MSNNFIDRVKYLMLKHGIKTQKELATACNINESTISEWFSKGREPNVEHFLLISKKLKTSPEFLWYGTEDATLEADYKKSEVYHMAGAGMPYQLIEHEPIDTLWLKKEFLNNHIVVVRTKGHSMEPTIMDGAYLGVDVTDRQIVSGEMYALWIPYEGAIVKRITIDPRGTVHIISDNPDSKRYPVVSLEPRELDDNFIQGRIKWVIQKF